MNYDSICEGCVLARWHETPYSARVFSACAGGYEKGVDMVLGACSAHLSDQSIDASIGEGDVQAIARCVRQAPAVLDGARLLARAGCVQLQRDRYNGTYSAVDPLPLVEYLLDAGADPNAAGPHGIPMFATDIRVVDALLDHGASIDGPGPSGESPLIFAAYHSLEYLVEALLERGADPNHRLPADGSNALFHLLDPWCPPRAAGRTTQRLLAAGLDVDARLYSGLSEEQPLRDNGGFEVQQGGETVLHHAARLGALDVVSMLLAAGANPEAMTCSGRIESHDGQGAAYVAISGETPYDWAVRFKHYDVAAALAEAI